MFPSVTFCKYYMYTFGDYMIDVNVTELPTHQDKKDLFHNMTISRELMFKSFREVKSNCLKKFIVKLCVHFVSACRKGVTFCIFV